MLENNINDNFVLTGETWTRAITHLPGVPTQREPHSPALFTALLYLQLWSLWFSIATSKLCFFEWDRVYFKKELMNRTEFLCFLKRVVSLYGMKKITEEKKINDSGII